MYGVIVCPRCRRAKGVDLATKTTTCSCGLEIRVSPSRVKIQVSTARELAEAVGRIQAEIHGGTEEVHMATRLKKRKKDAYARVITAASRAGDRRQRMRAAAEGLAREFVLFSLDDWRRVAEAVGVLNPEESLEDLVRENVVYEPRPGYYRTV